MSNRLDRQYEEAREIYESDPSDLATAKKAYRHQDFLRPEFNLPSFGTQEIRSERPSTLKYNNWYDVVQHDLGKTPSKGVYYDKEMEDALIRGSIDVQSGKNPFGTESFEHAPKRDWSRRGDYVQSKIYSLPGQGSKDSSATYFPHTSDVAGYGLTKEHEGTATPGSLPHIRYYTDPSKDSAQGGRGIGSTYDIQPRLAMHEQGHHLDRGGIMVDPRKKGAERNESILRNASPEMKKAFYAKAKDEDPDAAYSFTEHADSTGELLADMGGHKRELVHDILPRLKAEMAEGKREFTDEEKELVAAYDEMVKNKGNENFHVPDAIISAGMRNWWDSNDGDATRWRERTTPEQMNEEGVMEKLRYLMEISQNQKDQNQQPGFMTGRAPQYA